MTSPNMSYRHWTVHDIWVDRSDYVWLTGNGHVVVKYTNKGKFVLQIGKLWYTGGSNDKQLLGRPTAVGTGKDANEV